jgi:carbonic anhydrase/acetyltransferase-like protein (isoleucine patch superfamily)
MIQQNDGLRRTSLRRKGSARTRTYVDQTVRIFGDATAGEGLNFWPFAVIRD